ncbi:MAG TPA: hypothetical protein EYM78_04625 [Gemmatimonadetes bacterium]|nr:hypothetical protein [Gemmatimonadota bacterium]
MSDFGRQVSDGIARREVYPDFGVVLYGRVRDQVKRIAVTHGIQVTVSTREHRPVYRRPEAGGRVGGKWR